MRASGHRAAAASVLIAALSAAGLGAGGVSRADAKGLLDLQGATHGVTVSGSPYRYYAVSPGPRERLTVVLRNRRADGRLDRWWYLRGGWFVPAAAYDGAGGGLSADGGTLVLVRDTDAWPPARTRLAVLDTNRFLRHPQPPGARLPAHAVRRVSLPGSMRLLALSPHGTTAYLAQYRGGSPDRYRLRAVDLRSGRLRPAPLVNANDPGEPLHGVPISQAYGAGGQAYTLFDGTGGVPYVEAVDTASGTAARLDLPGLPQVQPNLFLLGLRLAAGGRTLEMLAHPWRQGEPTQRLISIDVSRLGEGPPTSVAAASGAADSGASLRVETAGHSLEGRRIVLRQVGDSALSKGRLLVFGCIHGDECGIAGRAGPYVNGCPDRRVNAYLVTNLNPDGTAAGSRLNSRGVDLNRNFPAGWRPSAPGGLEYSGPRPFSEPETRLAARLIRGLRPRVTIWFHEHRGPRPLVRAWGPSLAAGRRFANLAAIPFHAIPWPAGTAPNWQNHRFPNSASFVVEMPRGRPGAVGLARLNHAIDAIGRAAAED
jgi:protein MpaA